MAKKTLKKQIPQKEDKVKKYVVKISKFRGSVNDFIKKFQSDIKKKRQNYKVAQKKIGRRKK